MRNEWYQSMVEKGKIEFSLWRIWSNKKFTYFQMGVRILSLVYFVVVEIIMRSNHFIREFM